MGSRGKFALLSILGSLLLFIPSCVGVMAVVDAFRYGEFKYATASEINHDPYIELPPNAKQIVLHRNSGGHIARFEVDTEELLEWIEKVRALRPELSQEEIEDDAIETNDVVLQDERLKYRKEMFLRDFDVAGWNFDPQMRRIHIRRGTRGAGYTVWHAPESDVAYLRAGYW